MLASIVDEDVAGCKPKMAQELENLHRLRSGSKEVGTFWKTDLLPCFGSWNSQPRMAISWRLGPVETMRMGVSISFSMKST